MHKILLTTAFVSGLTLMLLGVLPPRGVAENVVEVPVVDVSERSLRAIDSGRSLGVYQGFGIGMHPGDVIYADAINALDLEYARLEFGPLWYAVPERIPVDGTLEEMVAYIARNYDGDAPDRLSGAKFTHDFLRDRDIELILIHFELPYHWRQDEETGLFLDEYIDDLARFYTAHLLFLKSEGVTIDYIELANEPDGHWNGRLVPESYAHLVRECGRMFAENGLESVKILGPGLAFITLYGQTPAYMDALAGETSDYLAGWSTHIWDEVEFTSSRVEYIYGVWQSFLDGIERIDPKGNKPIFVTEYGCDVLNFSGKEYVSPRKRVTDTSVDSWDYALRVVANSIAHLNRGANALVLYRLSNAHWHKTGWGIIQPETKSTYSKKPVFSAVERFMADLPIGAEVLEPVWYVHDDPVVLSAFRESERGETTLLLANTSSEAQQLSLELQSVVADLNADAWDGGDTSREGLISVDLAESDDQSVVLVGIAPQTIARIQITDTKTSGAH